MDDWLFLLSKIGSTQMTHREKCTPRQGGRQAKKYTFKDYFFMYSWNELQSLHHLRDAMVFFYLGCGFLGFVINPFDDRGASAIMLGGIACSPGYRLGLLLQKSEDFLALENEHLMAWRIGNVAKMFSVFGVALLIREFL